MEPSYLVGISIQEPELGIRARYPSSGHSHLTAKLNAHCQIFFIQCLWSFFFYVRCKVNLALVSCLHEVETLQGEGSSKEKQNDIIPTHYPSMSADAHHNTCKKTEALLY